MALKVTTSLPTATDNRINQAESKGSRLFWKDNINEILCTRKFLVWGRIPARKSLEQPSCTVPNLEWCSERTTEPRTMQLKFTVHPPCRPGVQHLDSETGNVREQIIITHIVCMQHSEELRIGDELHSWRLQQQGDFLRIHRRKGTFPPNLWTKKNQTSSKILLK